MPSFPYAQPRIEPMSDAKPEAAAKPAAPEPDHFARLEDGFSRLHDKLGKAIDDQLALVDHHAKETVALFDAHGQAFAGKLRALNQRLRQALPHGSNFGPAIEDHTERGRAEDAEIVGETKPAPGASA